MACYSVYMYVQQAVQTKHFMLFQLRLGDLPGPEMFSSRF